MEEFISEPIQPHKGTFDAGPMAAGLPGLPRGFQWRGTSYEIVARLDAWKQSGPELGRADGERYLRRHCFRLRMSDGSIWTIYFTRQPLKSGSAKRRWYLLSIERAEG